MTSTFRTDTALAGIRYYGLSNFPKIPFTICFAFSAVISMTLNVLIIAISNNSTYYYLQLVKLLFINLSFNAEPIRSLRFWPFLFFFSMGIFIGSKSPSGSNIYSETNRAVKFIDRLMKHLRDRLKNCKPYKDIKY